MVDFLLSIILTKIRKIIIKLFKIKIIIIKIFFSYIAKLIIAKY